MKKYKFDLAILISIIGVLLSLGGFVVDSFYLIGFGVIAILIYISLYVKENIVDRIRNNEKTLEKMAKDININKEINNLKTKVSFLEGVQSMMKNKKGFLDPISLIIIIILLALLIMFLKSKGIL